MKGKLKSLFVGVGLATAALGFYVSQSGVVSAADHNDPVRVQASGPGLPGGTVLVDSGDPAGDIADLFARAAAIWSSFVTTSR